MRISSRICRSGSHANHKLSTPIVILGMAALFAWPFMEWNSVKPPPKDGEASQDASGIEKVDSAQSA